MRNWQAQRGGGALVLWNGRIKFEQHKLTPAQKIHQQRKLGNMLVQILNPQLSVWCADALPISHQLPHSLVLLVLNCLTRHTLLTIGNSSNNSYSMAIRMASYDATAVYQIYQTVWKSNHKLTGKGHKQIFKNEEIAQMFHWVLSLFKNFARGSYCMFLFL